MRANRELIRFWNCNCVFFFLRIAFLSWSKPPLDEIEQVVSDLVQKELNKIS